MTQETSGHSDTTTEAQLRAEIDQLKRQIEHHKRERTRIHRPSRSIIAGLLLLVAVVFVVAFFVGYLPKHRRELQLTAEANVQNEALPEVSVATAVRGAQ